MGFEFPIVKFNMKGRLICPRCSAEITIPADRWVARGIGRCPGGHDFAITDDVSYAVNDILSKTREGDFRKKPLSEFEELNETVKPHEEGGGIILPGPSDEDKEE